ncbi:hypothetical protein MUK42_33294 [Musa troglodytarum]|nr:hypothetical protein MUK42_33294 [Musa troglodytarum]
MDKLVVESASELADKLLLLNLEEENQLQNKVAYLLLETKESKNNVQQLQTEHDKVENSIKMLSCQMSDLDKRKTDVLNEIKLLHQRIDERNWGDAVQDMIRMLKLVKGASRKPVVLTELKKTLLEGSFYLDRAVIEGTKDLVRKSRN